MVNPNILTPGLVNPNNAHFPNPGFSSKVGAVAGCGGPVNSPEALMGGPGIYNVVKTGGKRKKGRGKRTCKKGKRGGGYGMSKQQSLAKLAAPVGRRGHTEQLASFDAYTNAGQNSDTNMGASHQYSSKDYKQGGGSSPYGPGGYGRGGVPYYGYAGKQGADLSMFAGSGYPPITTAWNKNCPPVKMGGKRKNKKTKAKRGKKKFKKGTKSKTRKGHKDFETSKKSKRYSRKHFKKLFGRKTMRAPDFPFVGGNSGNEGPVLGGPLGSDGAFVKNQGYLEAQAAAARVGNSSGVTHAEPAGPLGTNETPAKVHSGGKRGKRGKKQKGGYHQYLGNVAFAHGYSSGAPPKLSAAQSGLANPSPHQAYNHCRNTWKHTGSE